MYRDIHTSILTLKETYMTDKCECFEKVYDILEKYKHKNGVLIPLLQEVQAEFGFLPEKALQMVTDALKIPMSKIYGVVTFYSQFKLQAPGKYMIKSCQGTACYVRGGNAVLQTMEDKLKIKSGETTPDLLFTLETIACLGACFLAPVAMVNNDYHGQLNSQKVEKILNNYK